MSVTLLRPYMGFASGAVVTLPDDTEAALIAQGIATAKDSDSMSALPPGSVQFLDLGGAVVPVNAQGQGTPTYQQATSKVSNTPLGALALSSYDTNGSVHVAGTLNVSEIYVPNWMVATGAAILNGTTVGTDKSLVALYSTSGALLRNSAVAGATTSGASTFQQQAFTSPILLAPGRYFIACQMNGTTDTTRKILSANQPNTMTTSSTGTFGTVPAAITAPTTHTTAVGVIQWLYT